MHRNGVGLFAQHHPLKLKASSKIDHGYLHQAIVKIGNHMAFSCG